MSNPITTSVTRTASTTTSLQATRPWLSNSRTSPLPADTASTDFHAVLSREDATNSPIGNDSSVLMTKALPHPASSTPNPPENSSPTASTAITHTSGRKEMPRTAKTLPEPVADAEGLSRGNRTPDEEGSTTLGATQPPQYSAPAQTMPAPAGIRVPLASKPTGSLATSKDSAQDAQASARHAATPAHVPQSALLTVLPQVEPVQANLEVSPIPLQPANGANGPDLSASALRDASVTTISSGSGDVRPSSNRPGHTRTGSHPDAGASSMISNQEGQKPDPMTTTQVLPVALAPSATSILAPIAASSSRIVTSSQSAGSQGSGGVQQIREIAVGSGGDASTGAGLPVTSSPVTSSASACPPAASLLPSAPGTSETTSPGTGKSSPQDLAPPPARHPNDDSSAHPFSRMTATAASGAEPVTALAVADAPAVDPAAALAPFVMLPVKPVASYMTNASVHTATSQVAPAIISLATRTDGSNEITVSLNPRDLGQVEVHLVRESDGTTSVSITASNPETLQELSQNVHHLHAALDAASIPVDGRNLSFSATPAATTGQGQGDLTGRGASTGHDGSSGGSGGQDPGQGRTWQQNRAARSDSDDIGTYMPPAPLASRKSWQLSGLNITA